MNIYNFILLSIPLLCYNNCDTFSVLKRSDTLGIMTVKEAAQRWGVTPRRVGEYIRTKRIIGAYKIGAAWVMPDDTQKPPNIKSGRKVLDNR